MIRVPPVEMAPVKRNAWVVCAIAAVLLFAMPAFARQQGGAEREKPKPKPPALRGEYAMMAEVLKLDDEAKKKVEDQLAANDKALQEWEQGDGAKLKDLEKALAEAKQAKDEEKVKNLTAEAKPLQEAREKLRAENKEKVLALLTDEQRAVWAGFILRRSLMVKYSKLQLTDEQVAQIQKLCEEAAKTIPPANDEAKRKERVEALNKLNAEITEKVLTDAQREELKKAAEHKPGGEGKKPEGEGKNKPGNKGKDKPVEQGGGEGGEMGNPQW